MLGGAMPKWIPLSLAVLASLALVPLALVAHARVTRSDRPRIHLVPDMDNQQKFKPQSVNPLFADRRAARPPVPGTVARGELNADDHFYRGRIGEAWATTFPMPVTEALMQRGRDRFGIFCAACHGASGYGNGPVAQRADELQEGTWTPPVSYHTDVVRERPVGQIFNTITHGIRNMPAYGPQIPEADRWAIVAYVRALQRSQNARLGDVPPDVQESLRAK